MAVRRFSPARRLGLRARITLAFGLGALILSALLAGTTWGLTRENLLNQRVSSATSQAYFNAAVVRDRLPSAGEEVLPLLSGLRTSSGARPTLQRADRWFPLDAQFGEEALPASLREVVADGRPARMRYHYNGEPQLAVGVPIPAADAAYFEVASLDEVEGTLDSLAITLLGAALLTTLAGAGLGWWASRAALRPLTDVSAAAEAIAGGRLETRLEAAEDPSLASLAASFNDMARALQERIERDARFASDVSHELRSPLTTLTASVEVLQKRRGEMPERARAALDLLQADLARFQQLVEDLLEISRFDAGAARLDLDEVRLAELVMQAVAASTDRDVPVELDAELAGVVVEADKRRLVRVLANLIDNAERYGDGATCVSLAKVEGGVRITVVDAGPGVPPDEQDLIFERFSRGGGAGRRGVGEGVGLGLSLVAEHVRLHGGRVWVESPANGQPGSRFVVELPVSRR